MIIPKRRELRRSMRFNKVFPVLVSSADFAEIGAVARNISEGGMQIETSSPAPLGSEVRVAFEIPDSHARVVARAEVKNHYCFNYADDGQLRWARGMGVRFIEFLSEGDEEPAGSTLTRMRVLH